MITDNVQYQCSKNNTVRSSAELSKEQGIIQMSENGQSVMVSIELNLPSAGEGPMKSIVILSPQLSGTGSRCKVPDNLKAYCSYDVGTVVIMWGTRPNWVITTFSHPVLIRVQNIK